MVHADKILSDQQLNKLFKKLKMEKEKALLNISSLKRTTVVDKRIIIDYFVFQLIANTGLRVSEALTLTWSDLREDFLIIRPEVSKNGKKGTVYFGTKTQLLVDELKLLKYGILKRTNTDLLFSFSGKLPSRSFYHSRFKYWLAQSGLPSYFSIHSLRHSYATKSLESGLSLTFVRDQLRHSNISITSAYLHLTKKNRDKVKDIF